jgi:putative transposase
MIARQVADLAVQRGLAAPSYDRVYDVVRQMDPALLTLAHQGTQVYSQTFDLLYRREAEAPNEIWQADHTLLDLVVTNDKGAAQKPWLTVIIDDYSRALAGYMFSFEAPVPCTPPWPCDRPSGEKPSPGGRFAAFRPFSIRTMDRILPLNI